MRISTGSREIVKVDLPVTVDGVPVDPTSVQLAFTTGRGVRPLEAEWLDADYADGVASILLGPSGDHELAEGQWRVWWRANDSTESPEGESGWVVVGNRVTGQTIATTADVETALRRPLTQTEDADAAEMLDELVDVLELRLNRLLWPREITETHYLRDGQRLYLRKGPVRSITTILENGVAVAAGDNRLSDPEAGPWYAGPVVVTYQAGDDPPRPAVRRALKDIVARTIQAGVAAGSGTIKSYSVEGTSITYGDVGGGSTGASGRITVGDLRSIDRRRRPVLLT